MFINVRPRSLNKETGEKRKELYNYKNAMLNVDE